MFPAKSESDEEGAVHDALEMAGQRHARNLGCWNYETRQEPKQEKDEPCL
jgi:hypothetical protein